MDEQRQDNQLEPIYNSSVMIQDIALKTSREQWTIETSCERRSGRSMLAVQHDDDLVLQHVKPCSAWFICLIASQPLWVT